MALRQLLLTLYITLNPDSGTDQLQRARRSRMPDRHEKEWEGCTHATKIGFVFKFELVFSSNLFLVSWTHLLLSPLTNRECRTCCQGWTQIYVPLISFTISSETKKTIRKDTSQAAQLLWHIMNGWPTSTLWHSLWHSVGQKATSHCW